MYLSMIKTYQNISHWIQLQFESIALLCARLIVARVFFISGSAKWDGFLNFNTASYDLFLYEFFCPESIRPGALLLCDPESLDYEEDSSIITLIEGFAITAGVMEIVLPLLLIFGLFTRFAALGLLAMTLFIQLAVFPEISHWWNPAAWWATALFVTIALGPGRLSLDRLLKIEKRNNHA